MQNAYEVSPEKSESKRQLGRHNRRLKNNIILHFEEIGCEVDGCSLGQGPVVDVSEHSNGPSGFMKGREFTDEVNDCQELRFIELVYYCVFVCVYVFFIPSLIVFTL